MGKGRGARSSGTGTDDKGMSMSLGTLGKLFPTFFTNSPHALPSRHSAPGPPQLAVRTDRRQEEVYCIRPVFEKQFYRRFWLELLRVSPTYSKWGADCQL